MFNKDILLILKLNEAALYVSEIELSFHNSSSIKTGNKKLNFCYNRIISFSKRLASWQPNLFFKHGMGNLIIEMSKMGNII